MAWVAVGVAVVGGIASYAEGQSAQDQSKQNMEMEIKAEKELAQQKRDWELEDRKYRQDAVGNWAKFADPNLMPATYAKDAQGKVTMTGNAPQGHGYLRPGDNGQIPSSFQFNWPVLPK